MGDATRPDDGLSMAYRDSVRWSSMPGIRRLLAAAFALTAVLVAVASCGGSDGADNADGDTDAAEEHDAIAIDDATPTDIVIPTSTPLPTATALPTSTPAPLEEPTPSTVLLTTAFTNSSKVTTVGIDEVFFGMTAEEAAEAASTTWVGEPSSTSTCYVVTPASGPEGVTLWVVDGHVERLDIEHPDIRTPSTLGLGNSLAELESQLGGRLSSETADDDSVIATFTPSDPGDREFRIIFELVDDQVVHYRSGRIGIIDRDLADC